MMEGRTSIEKAANAMPIWEIVYPIWKTLVAEMKTKGAENPSTRPALERFDEGGSFFLEDMVAAMMYSPC
jgi:hypothetical protein